MSYLEDVDVRYSDHRLDLIPDISKATLRLELTNICNHSCITCPHSKQKRKPRIMKDDMACSIISQCGELGVKRAALFLNGEPFLVPNLSKYIKLCKDVGMEYVFVTTNGAKATLESIAEAIDAGLDSIKFSINSGSREVYKKVHGKDDFDYVFRLLKDLREYRDSNNLKCRILAGFVITDYSVDEIEEHYQRIRPYVDDICFFKPDNFGGYMVEEYRNFYSGKRDPKELGIPFYDYPKKTLPCSFLSNCVTVTAEGFLSLCCSEALNYMVVEDLNKKSLSEAWSSEAMQDIRRRHLENRLEGTQCYNCMYDCVTEVEPLNRELYMKSING